jgi:ketosteroid isomerase-like protein
LENGVTGEALAAYYAPDVVQEEFPNRLVANGARRDLAAILAGAERGQQALQKQRFEVRSAVAGGDQVALEVLWVGTLAVPMGSIRAGGEMRAHFALFLDFRDGQIVGQRNYDCFDPW